MKKYKINSAYPVNQKASKIGFKWDYRGKKTLEEAQEMIASFEKTIARARQMRETGVCVMVGLRVIDTETGEVIYENLI